MPDEFDGSAKQYDANFTYSGIGIAQRKRVYHFLNEHIFKNQPENLKILELNCGTGEDALYFWKKGHRVFATDQSEKMIEEARKKCKDTSIAFQQLDIRKINSFQFESKFHLIFSNFGGLNCISPSELEEFIKDSAHLMRSSGLMILVIMPKKCLWERIYFILKGQFRNAFRRNTKEKVYSHVDGTQVPTWYFQPKELIKMAKNEYRIISFKPIGICIPPSYLEPFFKNKKGLLNWLTRLERLFYFRFWSGYADHFIIAFEKK